MSEGAPFTPVINDYANGGFSIGKEFHKGSIQINGQEGAGYVISSWHVDDADALTTEDFSLFIEGKDRPDLIVLGVGSCHDASLCQIAHGADRCWTPA